MKRLFAVSASALFLFACHGKDDRWVEKQEKRQEEGKAQVKAAKVQAEEAQTPKVEAGPKDPFWDDPSLVRFESDSKCPDGMWALFPGKAPEGAKESDRADLTAKLKKTRFLTHFRPPADVKLGDYDAPKGQYVLETAGMLDCQDAVGHLAVLFGNGRAYTPPNSAAKEGAAIQLRMWQADPFHFPLPQKSMTAAEDFRAHHALGLEARMVFTLGRTEVDRKMAHVQKVQAAGLTIGGTTDDWGAGRAVHAVLEGMRVSFDQGRSVIADTRSKK